MFACGGCCGCCGCDGGCGGGCGSCGGGVCDDVCGGCGGCGGSESVISESFTEGGERQNMKTTDYSSCGHGDKNMIPQSRSTEQHTLKGAVFPAASVVFGG